MMTVLMMICGTNRRYSWRQESGDYAGNLGRSTTRMTNRQASLFSTYITSSPSPLDSHLQLNSINCTNVLLTSTSATAYTNVPSTQYAWICILGRTLILNRCPTVQVVLQWYALNWTLSFSKCHKLPILLCVSAKRHGYVPFSCICANFVLILIPSGRSPPDTLDCVNIESITRYHSVTKAPCFKQVERWYASVQKMLSVTWQALTSSHMPSDYPQETTENLENLETAPGHLVFPFIAHHYSKRTNNIIWC